MLKIHLSYVGSVKFFSGLMIFLFLAAGLLIKNLHGLPFLFVVLFIVFLPCLLKNNEYKISKEDASFLFLFLFYYIAYQFIDLYHGSTIHSRLVRFVIAALACYLLIKLRPRVEYLWLGASIGGLLCGIWAIYSVFCLDMGRAATYRFNAIHFAAGSISLSYISAAGFIWVKDITYKKSYWILLFTVGLIGGLVATVLTGSRGVWLSIIPVAPVLIYFIARVNNIRSLNLGLVLFLIFVFIFIFLWMAGYYHIVENRVIRAITEVQIYFNKQETETSVGMRLEMWRMSWLAFLEAPLMGLGRDGYYLLQDELIAKGVFNNRLADFNSAHSGYFDTLGKYGLLGFSLFLSFHFLLLYFFVKKVLRDDLLIKSLALAGVSIVVGYLIFNLTDIYLYRSRTLMVFLFPLVFLWAFISIREKEVVSYG